MAKRTRRPKKKQTTTAETTVKQAGTVSTRQEPTVDEFQLEYSYVLKDLRRIFLLAAAMFTLLIILNLVLR